MPVIKKQLTPGEKRRNTNLAKDPDFYKKLGKKGGAKSPVRPFADKDKARAAVNKRWAQRKAK